MIYLDPRLIPSQNCFRYFEKTEWPVSGGEYTTLYTECLAHFFSALTELKDVDKDLLFCDSGFLLRAINLIHFRLVISRCEKLGRSMACSDEINDIVSPDWEIVGKEHDAVVKNACSMTPRLKGVTRQFMGQVPLLSKLVGDRPTGAVFGLWGRANVAMGRDFGSNDLYKRFLDEQNTRFEIVDWEDVVQKEGAKSVRKVGKSRASWLSQAGENALRGVVGEISTVAKRFGVEIEREKLGQTWMSRLDTLGQVYSCVDSHRYRDSRIYVAGENNTYRKTLCLGLRAAGAHVSAFLHGETLSGVYDQAYAVAISRSFIENYYSPSRTNALLQQELYGTRTRLYSHVDVRYKGMTGSVRDSRSVPDAANQQGHKRLLLIGYPMNTKRYLDDETLFFHQKLALELQIINTLKKRGYDISYRPHPDRFNSCLRLFTDLDVPISQESFPQVPDRYDIFIFTHPTTSTFGSLLQTSAGLILFDSKPELWRPFYKKLLRRRCEIIELEAGKTCQPMFDEEDLILRIDRVSTNYGQLSDAAFSDAYFG